MNVVNFNRLSSERGVVNIREKIVTFADERVVRNMSVGSKSLITAKKLQTVYFRP